MKRVITCTVLSHSSSLLERLCLDEEALAARRVGVKASRDEYVALHVENPERTEKMISALPKLDTTHTTIEPPKSEGTEALSTSEASVAAMLGIDPAKMAETKKAEAAQKGAF